MLVYNGGWEYTGKTALILFSRPVLAVNSTTICK